MSGDLARWRLRSTLSCGGQEVGSRLATRRNPRYYDGSPPSAIAMSAALKPLTLDEFLAWERAQPARYEFDGVQPVAMTGGSRAHSRVGTRLVVALGSRVRPPCEPFGPDLKVPAIGRIRYPVASVVCGASDETSDLVEPTVVCEVVSPTTELTGTAGSRRWNMPPCRAYWFMSCWNRIAPKSRCCGVREVGSRRRCRDSMPSWNYRKSAWPSRSTLSTTRDVAVAARQARRQALCQPPAGCATPGLWRERILYRAADRSRGEESSTAAAIHCDRLRSFLPEVAFRGLGLDGDYQSLRALFQRHISAAPAYGIEPLDREYPGGTSGLC